ncbi:hypothetical protein [Flavobacterium anhuiense]|uniref:hypothetical protein n=1 Tax=Flavobacterium anhuiense TaxID=459526 RepID=UPI003D952941
MKNLIFILILFSNINIYSQSTLTSLNFGKNNDFHSTRSVLQTITNTTFYNSNNTTEQTKEIKSYNTQNNIVTEFRYDGEGNLKQRLTRSYDSTGVRCIGRKFENWHRYLGHTIEIAYYNYDSKGYLVNVTDKDQNGNIFRHTDFVNDEKGNPIEIINFKGNQIIGTEKNEYDYDKNEVIIKYFDINNQLMNSQTSKINFSKSDPADIVNEYGDIIKSSKYEMELKYDKFGNWIKKKYSTITEGKIVKKSETTRTIKYL